jgi:hypothetical protein
MSFLKDKNFEVTSFKVLAMRVSSTLKLTQTISHIEIVDLPAFSSL